MNRFKVVLLSLLCLVTVTMNGSEGFSMTKAVIGGGVGFLGSRTIYRAVNGLLHGSEITRGAISSTTPLPLDTSSLGVAAVGMVAGAAGNYMRPKKNQSLNMYKQIALPAIGASLYGIAYMTKQSDTVKQVLMASTVFVTAVAVFNVGERVYKSLSNSYEQYNNIALFIKNIEEKQKEYADFIKRTTDSQAEHNSLIASIISSNRKHGECITNITNNQNEQGECIDSMTKRLNIIESTALFKQEETGEKQDETGKQEETGEKSDENKSN